MTPLEQLLANTAARQRRKAIFHGLVKCLLWACLAALLVRLVNAYCPLPFGKLLFALLPFLTFFVVLVILWRRRSPQDEVAKGLDKTLDGHDQFATALECMQKPKRNEVETILVQKVNEHANSIQPERVVPIETPKEAKFLAIVLPIFMVFFSLTCYEEVVKMVTPIVQRTVLAKPIKKLEKKLKELEKSKDPKKKAVADKLKKLLGDLKGAKDFDDMLGKAKSLLEQMKKNENDPQAKQALEQMGKVAEFLSRSKVTRQLADALKKGDMQKAADLTRTLAERIRKSTGMTPQDLKRLAKNFKKSANVTYDPNAQKTMGQQRSQGGG